jgi:adenylate kinase
MIYVFLGMQGSGKGTQAGFLSKHLDLEHISLGEYFRKQISKETPLGMLAHNYISKGNLVPDIEVFGIINKIFLQMKKGFVFDGFPRTLQQAWYLSNLYPIGQVVYLKLEDCVARERMMARRICDKCRRDYNLLVNPPKDINKCDVCGGAVVRRADDTDELIQNRLDLFHNETEPLTEFYQRANLLTIVNAVGDIHDIFADIKAKLGV